MARKTLVIVLALLVGLSLLLPSISGAQSSRGYRGGGGGGYHGGGGGHWGGWGHWGPRGYPYYGYYGGHHGYWYDGWDVAGAALGGLIVGGVIANAFIPRYVVGPSPAYAYPAPDYVPAPGYGYDAPPPPGEWIMVPGQWVGGRWIPSHQAWVPVNP
jgi:hypothetical protein